MGKGTLQVILLSVVIAWITCSAEGLYEDQAGQFDWHQGYVGNVLFSRLNSQKKRLYVGTQENAIAALSTSGKVIWRHRLEAPDSNLNAGLTKLVFHQEDDTNYLLSVSGGGQYVRAWDADKGLMIWEREMFSKEAGERASSVYKGSDFPSKGKTVDTHCGSVRGHSADVAVVKEASLGGESGNFIVAVAGKELSLLEIDSGKAKWSASLPVSYVGAYERVFFSPKHPEKIFVVGFSVPSTKAGSVTVGFISVSIADGAVDYETSFSLYYDSDFMTAADMSAIVVGQTNLLVTSRQSSSLLNIDLAYGKSIEVSLGVSLMYGMITLFLFLFFY